jgi:ubiquinone/menaquinone biosynthesis C-methylase UbiE
MSNVRASLGPASRRGSRKADRLETVYAKRAPLIDEINRVSPWHSLYRRRTVDILSPLMNQRHSVFDVAAGTGILAETLSSQVRQWTMIDKLPVMNRIANHKKATDKIAANWNVILGDVLETPAEELGRFNFLIMTQALNFFDNLNEIFARLSTLAEPGSVFYFDIDTPFRWALVEALSGRLNNALSIISEGRDAALNIVGADYYFFSKDEIIASLVRSHFDDIEVGGISYLSPLFHVFDQSANFLDPSKLDPRSVPFTKPENLECLYHLDRAFEGKVAPDAAGWMTFCARYRGPS